MGNANAAEQLEDDILPDKPEKDQYQETKFGEKIDRKDLTAQEVRDLNEHRINMSQLMGRLRQNRQLASSEMDKLYRDKHISLKEHGELEQRRLKIKSPQRMDQFLKELKALPEKKKEEQKKEKEKEKVLEFDHPEIQKRLKELHEYCDDNKDAVGTEDLKKWKDYFTEEARKEPSIKHMEELMDKSTGKIPAKDSFYSRIQTYNELKEYCKKFNIADPVHESPFIAKVGRKGKQRLLENAKALEKHFDLYENLNLYDRKTITLEMRRILLSKSPTEQEDILKKAKKLAEKEMKSLTFLDDKVEITGIKNIRKMSRKSKQQLLENYRKTSLEDRPKFLEMWEKAVRDEASLAAGGEGVKKLGLKSLTEIFKDDQKGLRLAIESFEELDFEEKTAALREYQKLVGEGKDKNELHKELLIRAAHAKIEQAQREKIISQKTCERYKKAFEDENNYKNKKTGKPGDVEELEKQYKILINPEPQGKNLAAYKERRKKFQNRVKDLEYLNLGLTDQELAEWNDKYDEESWTGREKVMFELLKEIQKQKMEKLKERAAREKAGIKETANDNDAETKERPETLEEMRKNTMELLEQDHAGEAMQMLLDFNRSNAKYHPELYNNPKVLFLMKMVGDYISIYGTGDMAEQSADQKMEEAVDHSVESDVTLQRELKEAQMRENMLEGTRLSRMRYQKEERAEKRAKKEVMEHTADSEEKEIIEDYLSKTDEDHYMDAKTKTGAEMLDYKFTENRDLKPEEIQKLQERLYKEQDKLHTTKEGYVFARFTDKEGRRLTEEQTTLHHEKELDKLEQKIAEKAAEKTKARLQATEGDGAKVYDMQAKLAAKRKARSLIEEKTTERIKKAA